MHFTAALFPLFALAGSLVEAAPVASTTAASRGTFRDRQSAYQASVSSSSSAAAAAASSSSKQVWYVAPTTTTTSQRPSRSTFKDRQSAYQASVSSASSASVASAIAAVPTDRLFPSTAPALTSFGRPLSYKTLNAYVWNGSTQDSSVGADLVSQFPGRACRTDDPLLIEARAKGRTIVVPVSYRADYYDRISAPVPAAPCGAQVYVRNPSNPSQGAYFAVDGILRTHGGVDPVETHAMIIDRSAAAEVFGADFKEGQPLELAIYKTQFELIGSSWLSGYSSLMATATAAP
ncbi:hypothetical protein JCM6882_005006 [Rhodosporidiobolus microsporus]